MIVIYYRYIRYSINDMEYDITFKDEDQVQIPSPFARKITSDEHSTNVENID